MTLRQPVGAVFLLCALAILFLVGRAEADSKPYTEEEVKFKSDDLFIAGTLLSPSGENLPSVILIIGSSRSARNEFLKIMASNFASHGIAALVFDSPGTGGSTGDSRLMTVDDRAKVVLSAIQFLKANGRMDPHRIGLWGISEGASVSLIVASQSTEIPFLMLISGPMTALHETNTHRITLQGKALGLADADIRKAVLLGSLHLQLFNKVDFLDWQHINEEAGALDEPEWIELIDVVRNRLRFIDADEKRLAFLKLQRNLTRFSKEKWFSLGLESDTYDQLSRLPAAEAAGFFDRIGRQRNNDLEEAYIRYRKIAESLHCPMLAVYGGRDTYINGKKNAEICSELLKGHENSRVLVFDEANHRIETSPFTFPADYLALLNEWVVSARPTASTTK